MMILHKSNAQPCSTVEEAMTALSNVVRTQRGGDEAYFASQSHRFRYSTGRIHRLCSRPSRILDIGSHYLHQSSLLSLLGHEIIAVDIALFTTPTFVMERAAQMGITNVTVGSLEYGDLTLGPEYDGTVDIVVFTAILEHITFNPILLWRRIYELLSDRGKIYLVTPNGLRPAALLNHLVRLITLTGVGLPVREVLGTITYGHHWKEYSRSEIEEYFKILSPDFVVSTAYNRAPSNPGLRGALSQFASVIPMFRPELEAVVSLSGKTGRIAPSPELPMSAKSRS
jgi:2-polyprenyl-6-hydroxyphenyl methylase/3-demethylubiquinone-9 3-methyltransferase